MTEFQAKIVSSIAEISPPAWDRLSGSLPFASHRWYRLGEKVLDDGRPLYIHLLQDGEMVARATFWLDMQEALPFASAAVRRAVGAVLHRWPVMTCRSPLLPHSGLILPPPPRRAEARRALARAALEQARQHSASFLLFDYLEPEEIDQDGWPAAFASFAFADPDTTLSLTWPSFDDYISSLRKSMRKDYRRHCNRAADLGIEVTFHSTITTPLDEAMTLIENVHTRHGDPVNFWTRRMLQHIDMVDATWLTAKIGQELVGCGLLVSDGDTLAWTLLGLNYDVKYVYFQLVYASIRYAIQEGFRAVLGGRQAYQTKARLGFKTKNNHYVMFKSRVPLLQRVADWLAKRGNV